MSARTGLSPLEIHVLSAIDELGGRSDRPHRKVARVLTTLEDAHGYGPRYTFEVLCNLAQGWEVWVPLVDPHGNFGSPDDPPADPRYIECRLSPVGSMTLASERGVLSPLPIDLLNGNTYRGGMRPPFLPRRLLDALLALVEGDPADEAIVETVGPPAFPVGCEVSGQIAELIAGERATLVCTARFTREDDAIVITHLPPGIGVSEVGSRVTDRVMPKDWIDRHPELANEAMLRLRDVRNESRDDQIRLVCEPARDTDPAETEAAIRRIWGVTIRMQCTLGMPLATLLRTWVAEHAEAGTRDALLGLHALVAG